jgi:hypothetical protein
LVASASEVLEQLTESELMLARQHLFTCAERLQKSEELPKRYASALRRAEAQKTV